MKLVVRWVVFVFLGLFFTFSAFAKTCYVAAQLENLTQVKSEQRFGDQVYVHVTENYSDNVHKNYNISSGRLYWQFSKHGVVRNASLWQGKLDEGEFVTVIFTVLERDTPPFYETDRVGSIVLKVKNKDGKLFINWLNGPHTKKEATKDQNMMKFQMSGSGSFYELTLKVSGE